MKLEHLKLENFRGFSSFEITFDPSFTVLLGENMAGKTAVLEAAAVALSTLVKRLGPQTPRRDILDHEIYQVVVKLGDVPDLHRQLPVCIRARATVREASLSWTTVRESDETISRENGGVSDALKVLTQDGIPADLPIIALYGTQRVWRGNEGEDPRGVGSRYDGYAGCFDITSTHALLAGWMRKQTLVQLQRGGNYVQVQLAAVEAAVKCCIDQVVRFWFDVQYDELRLERTGGDIQSFAMLSEGVRNMVAMVADIAWRAAVLNPHLGTEAHTRTAGVVLIDELDLHLHPAWQRRVVGDLRRTFPQIQFVVTTHSPQVVASVNRAQVRILDRNQLVIDKPHVEGRDANAILEDVFGVPERPESVQAELDTLYRLIEDEEFAAARAQLALLQARLGPEDAAMIRARWMLDTDDPQPHGQPPSSP
jgi:predicted ATP-binding protein involved in virulence